MKADFLLTLISLIVASGSVSSETIFCEETENHNWISGKLNTCFIATLTTINSIAVKIAPADSSIHAINFSFNEKVSFLPIEVDKTYPNLVGFAAPSCSIKQISKKNFKNMKQLKELYLDHNQIVRIDSNTFEDLVSLEILGLGFNIIKEMNGALFANLQKLRDVSLSGGTNCVDFRYKRPNEIARLPQKVDESCGFAEFKKIRM